MFEPAYKFDALQLLCVPLRDVYIADTASDAATAFAASRTITASTVSETAIETPVRNCPVKLAFKVAPHAIAGVNAVVKESYTASGIKTFNFKK